MLKLKLQYFGHLMLRADSWEKKPGCWERLKAGGQGDNKDEMVGQAMDKSLSKLQEMVKDRET